MEMKKKMEKKNEEKDMYLHRKRVEAIRDDVKEYGSQSNTIHRKEYELNEQIKRDIMNGKHKTELAYLGRKSIHFPVHSIFINIKFNNEIEKESFINNSEYARIVSRIYKLALKISSKSRVSSKTNP